MTDEDLYQMWIVDGLTINKIAKKVGTTVATANGRIQRHARLVSQQNAEYMAQAVKEADVPGAEDTSDLERWEETASELMALPRHIRVLVESDHHYIDQDPQAIRLKNQIAHHFQPDLNILNGDTFDFGAISRWAQGRSEPRRDVLKEVEGAYHADIADLLTAINYAPILHNSGNHNARLDSFLDEVWQVAQTVEEYYRKVIRADGAVMMFDYAEEIMLGNLMVQHGERVGENVARNASMDIGFGMAYIQGHGHTANTYYRKVKIPGSKGLFRVATSVQTGCLCRTPPRYSERRKNWTKWTQGIALAHINPDDLDVHVQNIVFHKLSDGSLAAAVGGEIFKEEEIG